MIANKFKSVEVLMSTMNQKDISFIDEMNIQSDVVIINQTDNNGVCELKYNSFKILFISDTARGLSKSRNLALENATGDICLLCDDDIQYVDGYVDIVKQAFNEIQNADIIIFDSIITDRAGIVGTKGFKKIKRVPRYKTFSSVLIAFRRNKIIEKNIKFNTDFGTGSGKYNMCEDSIFLRDCYKNGLKAYIYPAVIHKCAYKKSTWFNGYDRKYFFDIGAYLAQSYGWIGKILKWYYPFRMKNLCDLSPYIMIHEVNNGMRGYKKRMGYNEYYRSKRNS